MENHEPKKDQNETPLLLSEAEDYLGQWIALLAEHYQGELSELASMGYRIGLADLKPSELDLAFSHALKTSETGFRPTAGEIRKHLREVRQQSAPQFQALPEASLTAEEAKNILDDIREKAAALGAQPKDSVGIVEITDEMRARYEARKQEALERFGAKE